VPGVSAKIAADVDRALAQRRRNGARGSAMGLSLAHGDGWTVDDVVCTSGPADRPFEERHRRVSLAIVVSGTFQYRSTTGRALMTPGSILLGNFGHCFECGHEHAEGDRCVAFNYAPELFARIAADAGAVDVAESFSAPRIPPLRDAAGVVARASAGLLGGADLSWEEMAVTLAGVVARLASARQATDAVPAKAIARVTEVVRVIDRSPDETLTLGELAKVAGLSPYHFLRTFERTTGLTPHQYVRRARLRDAATSLATERVKVIDVAYESGFRDLSTFNRAFRAEFSVNPRGWSRRGRAGG
jgi:AraC family transcriptional regulator